MIISLIMAFVLRYVNDDTFLLSQVYYSEPKKEATMIRIV
jgi:hypothetical protein